MASVAAAALWELKSGNGLDPGSIGPSYCLATFPTSSSRNSRSCRIMCKADGGKPFRFGTRKTNKDEESSESDSGGNGALNLGTQLFKFGQRGAEKNEENVNLVTTPKKPLSLGLLGGSRAADSKTVFVTGATGQIGARISQQLLRSGFNVRGGVRDLAFAQQVAEFAMQYGVISKEEARRLNAVEFEFNDAESIAKAIGNAGRVVVTVGPTEDGPKGKVSPRDALLVIEAASLANVGHVVVVAEAGGRRNSGPLGAISDFFSKLFSQESEVSTDSLLDSVVDTELGFTIVKASSTQSVDDFSPDGNSVVLLSEGTYSQGTTKASKAQLASVVAGIVSNVSLAENKVLEVATINSDVPKPIEELLSSIPVDGRRAALAEARAKAEAEEEERRIKAEAEEEARKAVEEAKEAAELARELEQEAKTLAAEEARAISNAQKAKDRAKDAAASLDELGTKLKELGVNIQDFRGAGRAGFGGFFKKASTKSIEEEEEDVSEEQPKKEAGFGGFFKKAKSSEEEEDVSQEQPKKEAGFGGFFKKASARSSDEEEGESEEQPKKEAGFGRFLNRKGSSKGEDSALAPSPVAAVKKSRPGIKAVKEEKKIGKQKLFGGLFNQEIIYVDE